ncbi:MAG: hypothetical protein KKG47_11660 [Proteobacteria bacterium]|nr:hypothetical protein [Pseudomonadota bacterium]MBU1739468.1 hypothetical protein [Pseudomonadota bacterium]
MGHKHNQHRKVKRKIRGGKPQPHEMAENAGGEARKHLELVLKCGSEGSRGALLKAIGEIKIPGIDVRVISSGVGGVTKSDLLMAGTGSKLIIGFEIEVNKAVEMEVHNSDVEVRLYDVIYKLVDDLKAIGASLVSKMENERILGKAKVVALFKSCRKGIILGCEVLEGRLALGDRFTVIGAMGQLYNGRIHSLHIERDAVESAGAGRKVGLKIEDFNRVAIGDYVECTKHVSVHHVAWSPVPGVIRMQGNLV